MTSLQTLTVTLEIDNDGEFTTKVKSADGTLEALGKSAQNATKQVNAVSTSFSRISRTLSTLQGKLDRSATSSRQLSDVLERLETTINSARAAVGGLSVGLDGLSKSANKSVKQFKAAGDASKLLGNNIAKIAQNAGKGATGITRLGDAAKKSTTNINAFSTAASGVGGSFSQWSRNSEAAGEAVDRLTAKMTVATEEARNLRESLGAAQRTRGGAAVNALTERTSEKINRPQTATGGSGGESFVGSERSAAAYGTALDEVTRKISNVGNAHDSFIGKLTRTAFAIDEVTYAANIMWDTFGGGVEKIIEVNANTEKLITTLKGLSTLQSDADRQKEAISEYNSLFQIAQRSPFSLEKLADGFEKLKTANLANPLAALKSTSDALAHFGASEQQFESAMLALMQMSGKGVVSMEELRRQLGEAMPTAMQNLATAMEVTEGQLVKLVSSGSLQSASALQLLMDEFDRMYGGSSEQKMKTFSGQMALFSTNMQKLALTAGGRGMDGNYGPDSFYTEVTRSIETINKMLESPEAAQAARELNNALASITRTLTSLLQTAVAWGPMIMRVGEFALAVKSASLAVSGLYRVMEMMEGSKFLQNSGIFDAIASVGRRETPVTRRGAMGETIRAGERTSQGAFGAAKNFLGGIAEQGVWTAVSAKAGDAIGKINTYWQTTLKASSAGTALSGTLLRVVGGFATIATVAVPVALAIGGITLAWVALSAAMNRVTDSTNLVSKALQSVAQGDTSKDTMKAAQAEYDNIVRRRESMQRIFSQEENARQGQTFLARSFGNVDGVGALSSGKTKRNWFQRLLGESDDQWLEKGSAAAEQYRIRAQQALAAVEAEQEQAKRILDNAPTLKRDQDARNIESTTIADTNILMRSPEANYAAQMQEINRKRLALSTQTSDEAKRAIGELNDQQSQAVITENQQHIAILRDQIQSQVKLATLDKQAGNTDGFLTRSKAIELLNKDLQDLQTQLDAAQARLGKFDLNTASKAMDRERKNAENWLNQGYNRLNTMRESRDDNMPGVSVVEQMRAWQSSMGKFSDLGKELKDNMMDMAERIDAATASTNNWNAAMKAVKVTQDEINKSSQDFAAASLQSQLPVSPLGKDYSTQIAQINQNEAKGLRNLDIDSSGIDPRQYDSITESLRQMNSAYSDLQDTLNGYTSQSSATSEVTQGMTNDVNIMSQTVGDTSGGVDTLTSALSAYELQAASAGKASEDLANQMRLINAADIAKTIAGASAALRGANADIEAARRQKEAAESPQERRRDREQDISKAYAARSSQIANILGNAQTPRNYAAIAAMAKQQNTSAEDIVKQLEDAQKTIDSARTQSMDAVQAQYNKSVSHVGGSRSNPVNSLRENIAKMTAELNGGDGAMARFGQRMADMKKPIDATTKSLMEQDAALRQQVEAQKTALRNAEYFIQNTAQSRDEANASIASLGTGDPSGISAALAKIKARYDSVIRDVRENVKNPEERDRAVEELRSSGTGAYDNEVASRIQQFHQKAFEDESGNAYSMPDKRLIEEKQLYDETVATNEAIIRNTDFTEETKRRLFNETGRYYAQEMERIRRENEGALTKSGRDWSDWNKGVQTGVNDAMDSITQSMSDAIAGGKMNWKSFGESILKIFSDLAMKLAMSPIMTLMGRFMDGAGGLGGKGGGGWANILTNALGMGSKAAGGLGGAEGLDLSGETAAVTPVMSVPLQHTGGISGTGEGSGYRSVPADLFNKATRYHTGGIASDEVPTILQKGEGVFTKGQMAALGNALSSVNKPQVSDGSMALALASMARSSSSQVFDAKSADNAVDNIGKSPRGSANVKINMNNQSGQGMKMSASQPKWDGEQWVIDTVIKHAQRPGNLRTTLKST